MIRGRKDCLGGQACEPASIPEALHCLVEHSALDVTQLATAVNNRIDGHVSRSYLYELANPHRTDRGSRVLEVAAALTTLTGRPVLLRFLSRLTGGEFVQLPTVANGASDALRLAADTLREFAEAMQAFADGAADRSWSDEEVARLERESHDAIERILQTVEHARRHVGLRLPVKASMMAKAAAAAAAADTKRGAR